MKHVNVAKDTTVEFHIPSAPAFELAPELAVLSLLDASCLIAIRALACVHPEIGSSDDDYVLPDCAPAFPSASACTASCIIAYLDALRFGISSYRRSRSRELPGIVMLSDQEKLF